MYINLCDLSFFAPTVKPVFTTKPTCTLIEPTLLQCHCDGVGIPDPSIQWKVKGDTNIISSQSQLNITLNKDTEGNYTCSLANVNGVESEDLDIAKYGKQTFFPINSLYDSNIIMQSKNSCKF